VCTVLRGCVLEDYSLYEPPSIQLRVETCLNNNAPTPTIYAWSLTPSPRFDMNKDADRHVVASEPGRAMAAAAAGRPSSTVPNARPSQEVTVSAWTFEIICSVFGAICLAVIIVLLCAFDHRQQPQWPMGVTINSVVAFLATLCRSAFMVPVAEGISQMKWNLFATERPRPLSDLVAVDEASRGIWGTTKLLSLSLGR